MKQKILIVEDDPKHLRVTEMSLRGGGYVLLKATDGEEALRIVKKEQPDLIIMDLNLPKMSGIEVTERLRQNKALNHIPIIAVTAYAMSEQRERAIGAGCDAFVPKPFNTHELPALIAQMLLQQQKVVPSTK